MVVSQRPRSEKFVHETCRRSCRCVPYSSALFGQGRGGPKLARIAPSDKAFDPHDLSGIWTRKGTPGGYGGGGTCADCGDRGFGNDVPPFTPLGQKMFDANKPSYGRLPGSPDAAAHPEEAIGRRRAVPPRTELTRTNIAIQKA